MAKYMTKKDGSNDLEFEKIGENEVRFHRRWIKQYGILLKFPGKNNLSHYHGSISIPSKVADVKGEVGPVGHLYTVTELGTRGEDNGAFYYAKELDEVVVPGTVKVIYDTTFEGCVNLHKVTLVEGIQKIESGAFSYCRNLHEIILPDSLQEIGENVFFDCRNLTEITIGKHIKSLCATFGGCTKVRKITCRAEEPPVLDKSSFSDDVYQYAELFVPKHLYEMYKIFPYWKNFRRIVAADIDMRDNVYVAPNVSNGTIARPSTSASLGSTTSSSASSRRGGERRRGSDDSTTSSSSSGKITRPKSGYGTPPTSGSTTPTSPNPATPVEPDNSKLEHTEFMENGIRYWVKDAKSKVVYVTDKSQEKYKEYVVIPQAVLHEGVTYQVLKVGNYAFKDCDGLIAVVLPDTIKGINDYAFAGTAQLISINSYALTPPAVNPNSFAGVLFDKVTIFVPENAVSAYKSAEGWKNFAKIVPLGK